MAVKKFRVAICGGGIGGLATAVALSKYPDIEVDIYEAFSEVGAGIGVWPRVWQMLAKMGLGEDLAKVTASKPSHDFSDAFIFRKSDQPEGLDFYILQSQVLMNHLSPSYNTHFSKRLHSYVEQAPGCISLYFMDNSIATCDILIGADGIKSAVRASLLTERSKEEAKKGRLASAGAFLRGINPSWTGITAYRALVPAEKLKAYRDDHPDQKIRVPESNSIPVMYMGQHMNVVVYPISSGKLINVAAFHAREELAGTPFPGAWVTNVEVDDLLATHANWEPELQAILRCADKPSRWAIHVSKPLTSWVLRNVVLLGDAAHAMSPHQASGAGQAIEDAFVLATLLGHHLTRLNNVSRVLSIYDTIRRPFAMEVTDQSLINGRLFGLQLSGVPVGDDPMRLAELGDAIKDNWEWTWSTTIDSAVKEAVLRLETDDGILTCSPSM